MSPAEPESPRCGPRVRVLAAASLALAVLAWPAAPTLAQDMRPSSQQRLRDAEFGVSTRQFGLQRHVQMYQWRREGDGFSSAWISRAVDSSGFPQGLNNPPSLPVPVRYWIAEDVTIQGHPLDRALVEQLGIWRDFRPGFSALPAAVTRTYQPEGDGLGTAENPQLPRIGDVRIGWRELVLPPLAGRLELREGRWQLPDPDATDTELPAAPEPEQVAVPTEAATVAAPVPDIDRTIRSMWWWNIAKLAFAITAIVLLLIAAVRRGR